MLAEGMFLVDRYEIVSKIGAGGMSDVYKAKDHILGRMVAIKVLKQEFSEDINFVTKFRTEAQSAAGLEHPNIVNIYDVGSENGMHFIVMEYIEGITLKTYVEKKGQLSFKEATSIAIQVARGIESAHNKAITHRDIKPQNIMISTDGKVKVTDFGIAKAISSNTISSDAMGSVHYASPEQTRNGFIDGRSDIYSLGIVMYEMVTGRVPFDGDSTVAVAIQHLQEEMVVPSAYAPELPISYEKIILKCTQKNPERRYQAVSELLADLRQALVTPEEDFVVIAPLVMGDTRIINGEELDTIKTTADDADLQSENGFAGSEEMNNVEEIDDDDTSGFLNPKMEKLVTIGGIALAVLILAIAAFLVSNMIIDFMNFGKKDPQNTEGGNTQQTESQFQDDTEEKEMVEMIDVIGMSKEEAEKALEKIGLELDFIYDESDEKDGTVIDQAEKEGAMVEKGSTILVIVAGENPDATLTAVPDVVEEEEATAEKKLKDKGFLVTKDYEYSDTVEAGIVISQTPDAGDKKAKGTRVTIIISEGPEKKTVPADLIGKSESDAIAALEALGFVADVVTQTSNDKYPAGIVFKVNGAGTQQAIGSTIKIYVSNDQISTKVQIPDNLVGMTQGDAEDALRDLGFFVRVKDDRTSTQPSGIVTQVEMAGVEVEQGSTVTIYVSIGASESEDPETGNSEGGNEGEGNVTDEDTGTGNGSNTNTP
ncbi:MAG: Stk1 family PASTA domain-containing Ser/Thr kinase [Agathobacter sp.]|nr:Stk1 family PASTA domain-containing Ser/Thr kinase [Agathobacter sp.]